MIAVVLLWGFNFVIMKSAIREIPPSLFMTLRFAAGSLLMLFILRLRTGRLALPGRDIWHLLILGIIGNTLYQSMFLRGLNYTSAANGSLILTAAPIIVGLLGTLLGIERMRFGLVLAMLLGFGGVLVVFLPSSTGALTSLSFRGDLLVVGAMLSWAVYTLGVRRYAPKSEPIYLTTWTIVAGAFCLVLLNGSSIFHADWSAYSTGAWLGLLYSVVGSLAIAYLLWNMSVQRVGGVRTTIYVSLVPLVAALSAWMLLDEAITLYHMLGGSLIIASVWLARRS